MSDKTKMMDSPPNGLSATVAASRGMADPDVVDFLPLPVYPLLGVQVHCVRWQKIVQGMKRKGVVVRVHRESDRGGLFKAASRVGVKVTSRRCSGAPGEAPSWLVRIREAGSRGAAEIDAADPTASDRGRYRALGLLVLHRGSLPLRAGAPRSPSRIAPDHGARGGRRASPLAARVHPRERHRRAAPAQCGCREPRARRRIHRVRDSGDSGSVLGARKEKDARRLTRGPAWSNKRAMAGPRDDSGGLAVLRGLREHLRGAILGQDEAVAGLSDALLAGEMGHTPRGRPRSMLLILGPTGTGKTKAVTEASRHLYGTEAIARINCAEFSSEERVPLLLGSAEGARGLLGAQIERLRSAGGRILLLDEIEKASPRVSDYLLGIEEAAVTLASGKTLDLSDLHVIATSNVGSAGVVEMDNVARSSVRRYVEQEAAAHFRPEVLARFTSVLLFGHLTREIQLEICRRMLRSEERRVGKEGRSRWSPYH